VQRRRVRPADRAAAEPTRRVRRRRRHAPPGSRSARRAPALARRMVLPVMLPATIVPCAHAVPVPARFERFREIDRASYELASIEPPPALVALAASVTDRALQPVAARMIRLVPGDYLLAHHDHTHDDRRVELMLDLSPAIVPGAEVRYRRNGAVFFR